MELSGWHKEDFWDLIIQVLVIYEVRNTKNLEKKSLDFKIEISKILLDLRINPIIVHYGFISFIFAYSYANEGQTFAFIYVYRWRFCREINVRADKNRWIQ